VEPCQLGCHPGCRDAPFGYAFATAQAVARARWRRWFAFSLALRLLARIVMLTLPVFFTWGLQSGWDRGHSEPARGPVRERMDARLVNSRIIS
jgi:hypothetical protein